MRYPTGNQCRCAGCHRMFSTESNFMRHLRDRKCVDPSEVGLREVNGVWKQPPPANGPSLPMRKGKTATIAASEG